MAPQRLQMQSCHWLVRELAVASDDDMRAAVGSLWRALSANSHTYYYLYSITNSLFLSRLKTSLFCKSFPPQRFFFFFRIHHMDSPDCLLLFLSISIFYFSVFLFLKTLFSCRFRAVD